VWKEEVTHDEKNGSERDVFSGSFHGESFRQSYRPQTASLVPARNPEKVAGKVKTKQHTSTTLGCVLQ